MISIGRLFKIIDDDSSGQINIDEFTKAVTEQKLDLSIDDIRLLFLAFDRDRSGEISYDEFLRVIRGERLVRFCPPAQLPPGVGPSLPPGRVRRASPISG